MNVIKLGHSPQYRCICKVTPTTYLNGKRRPLPTRNCKNAPHWKIDDEYLCPTHAAKKALGYLERQV